LSPPAVKLEGEGQKRRRKVTRIVLRMCPLNASLRTEGGFPPVKSEVTEAGQSPVPWTTAGSGPGACALLPLKLPPSYFHLRAATFSLFPNGTLMCVYKPVCPSSAKSA